MQALGPQNIIWSSLSLQIQSTPPGLNLHVSKSNETLLNGNAINDYSICICTHQLKT